MKLKNKQAIVTGADSGIGQAIAITFGREGASVVVHCRKDGEAAQKTVKQIQDYGGKAVVLEADFSDPKAAQDLFKQAVAAMGSIDILVNNAGLLHTEASSLDTPLDDFIHSLNIDLISGWALCQAAGQHMVQRGMGSIVNITSVHEDRPLSGSVAYNAAKGGMRNITRTLALELATKGVRVNNLGPGMIATPMVASALDDPEKKKQATERIPMGRPGEPQEIANVALLLASDDSSYVTGSTFFVDGGLLQKSGGA